MIKLIYEDEQNNKIDLCYSTSYFISNLEGFSNVESIINVMKTPNQDGNTEISDCLEARHLVILGEVKHLSRQAARDELIKHFNPKLKGKLTYITEDTKKIIYCRPESSPFIASTNLSTLPFIINLQANDPYWYDEVLTSEQMVNWEGGMTFPLKLPTVFSVAGEKEKNIVNVGQAETPITLEISGKATNPRIENILTGEYIKVISTLQEEDKMIITTGFGNKRVYQNSMNVSNKIDINSTFFSLNVGDNVIKFTTDDINDNANIKISYVNRYLGV